MHLRLRTGNRTAAALVLAVAATLAPCSAGAHGDWPARHGGVMNDGGETSFELVREKRALVAHVSDHGVPLEVTGGTPELQVRRAAGLQRVPGVARKTRIVFPPVRIGPGDELALKLVQADGSVAFGRFAPAAVARLAAGGVAPK